MFYTVTITFAQESQLLCKPLGGNEARAGKLARMANQSNVVVDNTTQYVFNVRFNVFNDANNTNFCTRNGIPFGEADFLDIIKDLNIHYNSFKIFFKYVGNNFYGGTDGNGYLTNIENIGGNDISTRFNQMTDLLDKDAININFVDQIETPSQTPTATATYQYLKAQAVFGRPMIILSLPSYVGIGRLGNGSPYDYTFDKSFIVTHEMGHTLGLFHTFENFFTVDQVNYPCEHVTRDSSNPAYNALTAGDMVHDTQAQRFGDFDSFGTNCKMVNLTGYVNTDCQGTLYNFDFIDYGNYMSYVYKNILNPSFCNTRLFTDGQGVAMRNYIANPLVVLGSTGILSTNLMNARGDVSSLYEPFVIGGGGGVINTNSTLAYSKTMTPNTTNTGVNVWNCGPFKMRFQPGFDYVFSNLPGTITQTSQQQFNGLSSTYIGVKIPILDPSFVSNQMTPVCFGTFEPYTSGDVKSITNMGNPYYTVEQLDEIKASDPDLYEKLQSGKYHIITKETDSGYIDQKVIYKN